MSTYNFLDYYFPKDSELRKDRVQAMRVAASHLVRSVASEVDTAPNSPFGDLFISPAAPEMASFEEAFNRVLSDMDPENLEGGTVYNCEWTQQFLLNFGIQDETEQRSYGVIRLVFNSNVLRELDRSTEFQVGSGVYRPFAPYAGPIRLVGGHSAMLNASNDRSYAFIAQDNWAVDLLVFGNAGQTAAVGTSVAVDRTLDGLIAAVALSEFYGGISPSRIQELARRVRNNFHSRTPVTRGGAVNLIHQQFPELTITGCIVSGDPEQMRDVTNPLQVSAGKLDLLVRTSALLLDTVTVRLRQAVGPSGPIYCGWLDLPETPIHIVDFRNNATGFEPELFSVSQNPLHPALTAAYGQSERLLATIAYQHSSSGTPAIQAGVDAEGVYADFQVTYYFDPALKICQEFLKSDEVVPAGVDLYVRWFVPVYVDLLEVDFNRKAGTTFNLANARAEIVKAYNSHRFENPAGPAAIDAALYYNGAHSVNSAYLAGQLKFSLASKVWTGGAFTLPTTALAWQEALLEFEDVPNPGVTSAYTPELEYVDLVGSTLASAGPRSVSYFLSSANLHLIERRSI